MKKYLVGGAVRDKLLNLPVQEKDWVVVGSNPQEMLNLGYIQVGKSFPVFLHPKNHEEYALARTEQKSGSGHTGFTCYTSPSITIEDDLFRRDLTINAMAYDVKGNLIDPYHGQKDIQLRLLKHVSCSFNEDPLRVLRVARFAARFTHMNFTIAPETLDLMKNMNYELLSLSPERIWIETKKALLTKNPQVYFQVLRYCGALKILFPELDKLFNISISTMKNQQINIGRNIMSKLSKIVHITNDLSVRFYILCYHFNIITTNLHSYNYGYHNFENSNLFAINNFIKRLRIPRKIYDLVKKVSKYHTYLHQIETLSPQMLMTLLHVFDCWRQPKRFEQIILIIKSNLSIPTHHNNHIFFQEKFLKNAFKITKTITSEDIINDGFFGLNISKELYQRRLYALQKWMKHNAP